MSGLMTTFAQMVDPLSCSNCHHPYTKPRILPCFHSFCEQCLRDLANSDSVIECPMCGVVTHIKESEDGLPPPDELLDFLVSSRVDDVPVCANCDQTEAQMYFCHTCNQPLCALCKDATHRARMFQCHRVIPHCEWVRPKHVNCDCHNEPYILYSRQQRAMLCIHCFRDLPVEKRSYCVDTDTAYHDGCDKLARAVQALREREASVQASIGQLDALLGEIWVNMEREKESIHALHGNLVDKLAAKKHDLLSSCDRQYEEKASLFKQQLTNLSSLLPTLHTNLVTSAAFSTTANKYEFLQLSHVLISRLKSITKQDQTPVSSHNSAISSDYKTHLARCLECILFPFNHNLSNPSPLCVSRAATKNASSLTRLSTTPHSPNNHTYMPASGRRANGMGVTVKFIDSKSVFANHCTQFHDTHSDLTARTEKLKTLVQDLYRDLTTRRVYAKCSLVGECEMQTDTIQGLLAEHSTLLLQQQGSLQKHWEESLERISNEQELYQAQINDVSRLKDECGRLQTIIHNLSPFVTSINSVTERLLPHLGENCEGRGKEGHQQLMDVINMITPDSQQRVDAIQARQEERLQLSANRTNPLDGQLIKQKGLLRAPGERASRVVRDAHAKSGEVVEVIGVGELEEEGEGVEVRDVVGDREGKGEEQDVVVGNGLVVGVGVIGERKVVGVGAAIGAGEIQGKVIGEGLVVAVGVIGEGEVVEGMVVGEVMDREVVGEVQGKGANVVEEGEVCGKGQVEDKVVPKHRENGEKGNVCGKREEGVYVVVPGESTSLVGDKESEMVEVLLEGDREIPGNGDVQDTVEPVAREESTPERTGEVSVKSGEEMVEGGVVGERPIADKSYSYVKSG